MIDDNRPYGALAFVACIDIFHNQDFNVLCSKFRNKKQNNLLKKIKKITYRYFTDNLFFKKSKM